MSASQSRNKRAGHLRLALKSFAERLMRLERLEKALVVFGVDAVICVIAILISFSLRVGALDFPLEPVVIFASVAVPTFIPIFYFTGAYSTIFRFAGGRTIMQLAKASLIYALPLIVLFMIISVPRIPRTLAVLQPMVFFGLVASSRIFLRYVVMDVMLKNDIEGEVSRVLIYGAGGAGQQLAASLRNEHDFLILGFMDDDIRLRGARLDGIPIFHNSELDRVIAKRGVDTVLLALPRTSRQRRSAIVEELRPHELRVQTLPNMSEIVGGRVSVSDLRDVQIEDLLGRDEVQPNQLLLSRTIVGKTVLVTGAGGSIGSELCRQIAMNGARRLVLFEVSEFALYQIDRELREQAAAEGHAEIDIVPVLGSVTNEQRLVQTFRRYKPDTVFHAAAYKHVPLVEANPVEGIRNNVIGTFLTARVAMAEGVRDFTLVSTDKAVRPTNVMGASKRAAEMSVQALAEKSADTRLSMVRFGNVLGSSGSVVPLFRQQIEAGGPITLTHKDVTRFFMTIPEAAQLVIQAGGMATGGEVFLLDMGKPVRIYDLARSMIQLSGLTVRESESDADGDIAIEEVGLRPGEKLYEELLIGEQPRETKHPRIMMARESYLSLREIQPMLQDLAAKDDADDAIALLKRLVPEFEHQRDNLEELDELRKA